MARRKSPAKKKTRSRNLCKCFDDTSLGGCARSGLGALEAPHKGLVVGGKNMACGVALDRCFQETQPDASRWDYVFSHRNGMQAVAIEVHHAAVSEVAAMLAKKEWASQLLAAECPHLGIEAWIWVAAPSGEIFFSRDNPAMFRLAEVGISFPTKSCELP